MFLQFQPNLGFQKAFLKNTEFSPSEEPLKPVSKALMGLGYTFLNPVLALNFAVYTFVSSPMALSIYNLLMGNLGKITIFSMNYMLDQFSQKTVSGAFKGLLGLVGILATSAFVYGGLALAVGCTPVISAVSSLVNSFPAFLSAVTKTLTIPGLVGLVSVLASLVATGVSALKARRIVPKPAAVISQAPPPAASGTSADPISLKVQDAGHIANKEEAGEGNPDNQGAVRTGPNKRESESDDPDGDDLAVGGAVLKFV